MATTQTGLGSFLVRLAEQPDLLREYSVDKLRVLEREGIEAEDREAIEAGDLRRIRKRLREEHPDVDVFNSVMRPGDEPAPTPPPAPKPKPPPKPKPK